MHYIYSELESKQYEKCIFPLIFFNKDIFLNKLHTVFKIDMLILDTIMEGTMSQNFDLGPRFYFMKCRK